MALEGLHHITAITADAPRNVDFYARVLGLRLVKKTVNFDAPDVYHLYFGDERGAPGSILTFFEFPNAARGRHGDGMPYRIEWRVDSEDSLAFWAERLKAEGIDTRFEGDQLRFDDFEGLQHVLLPNRSPDAPLRAAADDIPAEHALQGFNGVRAYGNPDASRPLMQALGMRETNPGTFEAAGVDRRGALSFDPAPDARGIPGAGTIHHIAWFAADDAELDAYRATITDAGTHPTPIIDRQYFHSVYFRIPSGVLFELATGDIGFDVDEPLETLGTALKLPPQHERLREQLEDILVPLPNPRDPSEVSS
ncbi:MAG: VOC family protein [Solirubrobacteraceae bacterium]|nr:VOC family protein [Solirubrobacteraceae bacterium]